MSDSELMRHGGAHNMPTVHTGAFALTWQPHVCTSRARVNRALPPVEVPSGTYFKSK